MENKQIVPRVLPSDIIIYDILTRVSLKSLVRFRCVCKNWSNLFFHNSLFINLHSQRNKMSTASGLIRTNDYRCLVFIDHNDKKETVMPITWGGSGEVFVKDSLNGLLILGFSSYDRKYYTNYVYNTISKRSLKIPGQSDNYYDFRLCYDPVMEKYQVVQVCESDKTVVKIRIHTLGRGDDCSWRDIVVSTPHRSTYRCKKYLSRQVYLNGSLYWIIETWVRRPATDPSRFYIEAGPVKPYILGLDTSRESFYTIKLPDEVSTSSWDFRNLNEMEGSLCLSEYFSDTHELKIWTLKKKDHGDGDEGEWMETFKFSMRNSMGNLNISSIRILAVLTVPKLKFIIMNTDTYWKSTYFSYNVESKQLDIIYGPKIFAFPYIHWHVNNIPNW